METNDHQLRLFLAVAQARSLRAAADKLQITQPALSKQVRALEARLPGPLFRRDGRGMELTPLGQQLFQSLAQSYSLVDAAMEAAATAGAGKGGRIVIATVNTLASYFLPSVAIQVRQQLPELSLSMLTASSPEVVERVERGRAEVGLVYDSAVDSDAFSIHPLFKEKLCGFRPINRSASKSLSAQALSREPLILPPQPYALRRAVERALGCPPQVAMECNSVSLSLDLAARHLGVAILPEHLPDIAIHSRNLERVDIFEGTLSRQVVAITRKDLRPAEPLDKTLTTVADCAAALTRGQLR